MSKEYNIQLSSNSNEGLRLAIESRPTYIGKFRQAYLQKLDRERALKACQFNLRKAQVQLKSKTLDYNVCKTKLEKESDYYKCESLRVNMAYLAIEMEEISDSVHGINQEIADAFREMKFCEQLIQEVIEKSGINFYELSEVEFQGYMTEETQAYQSRKIAAALLVNPQQAIESLLELPPEDRKRVLLAQQDILNLHTELVKETLGKQIQSNRTLEPISKLNGDISKPPQPLKGWV